MGRGVSSGGGQSSLGYLFGSGETTNSPQPAQNKGPDSNNAPPQKPVAPSQPVVSSKLSAVGVDDDRKQRPVAVYDSKTNNYLRTEGQNCGNFITILRVGFPGASRGWKADPAEMERVEEFKVGDWVRIRPALTTAKHGLGSVTPGSIGKLQLLRQSMG